jgi:FKBP-type peptidyl-prolyl cis-trans isomerase (trigger factor)
MLASRLTRTLGGRYAQKKNQFKLLTGNIMENEVWQQLLSLESRDIVQQWYMQINHKELNMRRAKEINSSSKQAREYFEMLAIQVTLLGLY